MPKEIKASPDEVSKSWDGKHELTYRDSSHRYKLDGKPCVSVTTFIKASYPTSVGLINWMKRQSSLALFETLAAMRFGEAWPTTEEEKKEIFKKTESAHEDVSREAADIGTITHAFAELHSAGKIEEAQALLDQVKGTVKWPVIEGCTSKYLDWAAHNKGSLMMAESLVASPTHLFCGKFDRLDKVNGKIRLRDYKTSKAFYVDQFVQLGAYALALFEWSDVRVDELEVIRFGKDDGTFEPLLIDNPDEIKSFIRQAIRCRETFEFKKLEQDERFDWRKR